MISTLIDSFFMLDQTLARLAVEHTLALYGLLFIIIFAETGLVVTPFLPGDSLLFIAGTIAASVPVVDVHLLVVLLIAAAILGDTVNYSVGRYIGPKVYDRPDSRFIKKAHLLKTQQFYDKYGAFTIVVGRFVPIVRTFAPFLAGVVQMRYRTFLTYNIIGGFVWITSLVYAGYLFGNIPWVKKNLSFIVIGIVIVSVMPLAIKYWQESGVRRR